MRRDKVTEPVRRGSPARFPARLSVADSISSLDPESQFQRPASEAESAPFAFQLEDSAGPVDGILSPGELLPHCSFVAARLLNVALSFAWPVCPYEVDGVNANAIRGASEAHHSPPDKARMCLQ